MQRQCLFLIGPMGCGKTAVGQALALLLERPFLDTDALVSKKAGTSVEAIFAQQGEEAFRAMESAALQEAIATATEDSAPVIATGGGIVLGEDNRKAMQAAGHIVYLELSIEERMARIKTGAGRPLLSGQSEDEMIETICKLDDERQGLYQGLADTTISNATGVAETVERIVQAVY